MGLNASPTCEIQLSDCRLPEDRLLGEEGEGWDQTKKTLDGGRISIAALSTGLAQGAFTAAKEYAVEREQFGQPISKFDAIRNKLVDMHRKTERAPPPHPQGRNPLRQRPVGHPGVRARETRRQRGCPGGRRGRRSDPRRLRLHHGLRAPAVLPRRETDGDRRRHQRDSAPRSRSRTGSVVLGPGLSSPGASSGVNTTPKAPLARLGSLAVLLAHSVRCGACVACHRRASGPFQSHPPPAGQPMDRAA